MKNSLVSFVRCIAVAVLLLSPSRKLLGTTFVLSVQTNGSGSVTRNPSLSAYPANSVVTVTATPDGGSYFSSWSGDASGTSNSINVQMTSNKTVIATFQAVPSYTLTIVTNGLGTISLSPPGNSYASNSSVTLSASPAGGWVFVGWSGDVVGTNNPISTVMTTNQTVTAAFAEPPMIDQPPQDVSVATGGAVNFTVHAIGTAPLSYQWWFNSSLISGATATNLTITNVQLSQDGTYSIIVSNAYGVSSNAAVLSITNSPTGSNVVNVPTEDALLAAIQIGGVVTFGFNGTINITNTINLTNDIVLDATGRAVTLNGNNAVRLFYVNPRVNFSATNLVLANGRNAGVNGANAGAQPAQSGSTGMGGAILDEGGTVFLTACTLISNSVIGGTGGTNGDPYPQDGNGGGGCGGAIYVDGGALYLTGVLLSSNASYGGATPIDFATGSSYNGTGGVPGNACGGAIYTTNSSVSIIGSTFSNNFTLTYAGGSSQGASWPNAFGGAIYLDSGSTTLSNCAFASNTAYGGDAPTVNTAFQLQPGFGCGGAIALGSGTTYFVRCAFSGNTAHGGAGFRNSGTGEGQGGAIYSSATAFFTDSSMANNQAISSGQSSLNRDGRGGAFYNLGTAIVNGTTFSSNMAVGGSAGDFAGPANGFLCANAWGGAIYNLGQLTMTNCTLALNSVLGGLPSQFSQPPGSAFGGGIYNSNGSVVTENVTVATNSVIPGSNAQFTGGKSSTIVAACGGANIANTNGAVSIRNTILAYPGTNSDAFGNIIDGGYNMSDDGSAQLNSGTSFNYTDPELAPLADNGGPTLTMALYPNSPAVDFGGLSGAPNTDQRGQPRPALTGMDIGAFELQSLRTSPRLSLSPGSSNLQLSFLGQAGTTYVLQKSLALAPTNWTQVQTIGPVGTNGLMTIPISPTNKSAIFRLYLP